MKFRFPLAVVAAFIVLGTLSPAYTAGDSARLPTWKADPGMGAG